MTGTCQSVKECCNPFIKPQLTIFFVLYNFLHVFKIFTQYDDISYQENFGSIARALNANIRNTTPGKMTGSTIL